MTRAHLRVQHRERATIFGGDGVERTVAMRICAGERRRGAAALACCRNHRNRRPRRRTRLRPQPPPTQAAAASAFASRTVLSRVRLD